MGIALQKTFDQMPQNIAPPRPNLLLKIASLQGTAFAEAVKFQRENASIAKLPLHLSNKRLASRFIAKSTQYMPKVLFLVSRAATLRT